MSIYLQNNKILSYCLVFVWLPIALFACPGALADSSGEIANKDKGKQKWVSQELKINDPNGAFEITCRFPKFDDSYGETISVLNKKIESVIKERVNEHKNNFEKREPVSSKQGSYLNISYGVYNPSSKLISVILGIDSYSAGAAHPNHWTQSINFNLGNARFLKLKDVFNSNPSYLGLVSKICISELSKKKGLDEAWIKTGAGAKASNFPCFYLDKEDLVILFDEYKVGPYSAGPQKVSIKYARLKSILDTNLGLAI